MMTSAWRRTPYSVCGLASCASCAHFVTGRCPSCVRGNALVNRADKPQCAVYECVKSQGIESCRKCRLASCPILESGRPVRCGLADYFAGERGGGSLVEALSDLRSIRDEHPPVDLPPRLKHRLPAYLAALHELAREGVNYVASAELALRLGVSPALVRKDLSTVGQWGRRSAGYRVDVLVENLLEVSGLSVPRRAAWMGCERLVKYPRLIEDFRVAGCVIAAAFCHDGRHVGQEVDGLVVKSAETLPQAVKSLGLTVAVIATDDDRAQDAAEMAAAAGLRSLLNLTDKILVQPRGTVMENVSPLKGLVSLLLRVPAPAKSRKTKKTRAKKQS
jgi:redox-sensing transcriptional repressor